MRAFLVRSSANRSEFVLDGVKASDAMVFRNHHLKNLKQTV